MRPTYFVRMTTALVSRFARDTRGGIMMIFGLVFTLLIFAAGMAIDFGRVQLLHDRMQTAADLAAVSGGGVEDPSGTTTQLQRTRVAKIFYNLNFREDFMGVAATDVNNAVSVTFPAANQIAVTTANVPMPTSFVRVFSGHNNIITSGASTVQIASGVPQAHDVLLLMDMSGSMNNHPAPPYASRTAAAKAAAKQLTSILLTPGNAALPAAQQNRVGVVAWDGGVGTVFSPNNDKATVDGVIDTMVATSGNTNSYFALNQALTMSFSNPNAVKAVLLMTDGGNFVGPFPSAQMGISTPFYYTDGTICSGPTCTPYATYPNYPNPDINHQSLQVCNQLKPNILVYSVGFGDDSFSPQDTVQPNAGKAVQNFLSSCATNGSPVPYTTNPVNPTLIPSADPLNPANNLGDYYFLSASGADLVNAFTAIATNLNSVTIIQ